MQLSRSRLASLLFAASAVGPVGIWLVLLSVAVPSSQTRTQHAAAMLAYVFTDPAASWVMRGYFILLAVSPALFVYLSIANWRLSYSSERGRIWFSALGVLATVVAVPVCWPVAITAAMGTYYGGKRAEA